MTPKTYLIGVLAIMATILAAANLIPENTADAAFSVKDNRYQLNSAKSARGGEIVYVIDNLTGQAAVMGWDNNLIVPLTVESITNLFK